MSAIIDRLRFVYRYAIRLNCANLAKTLKRKKKRHGKLYFQMETPSCGRQRELYLRYRAVREGNFELLGERKERSFYTKK